MARFRFTVTGRVQGVAFRYATQDNAVRLGLTGWVRNLRNGDVEGEFQGPEAACRELSEWLRKGPPMARVTELKIAPVPVREGDTEFDIRPTA